MNSCSGFFSCSALFLMLCIGCECQTNQEADVLLEHIQQLKQFLRNNAQAEHNTTRYNLTLKIQMVAVFLTPLGINRETTEIALNGTKTNSSGKHDNISYVLHESCDVVQSIQTDIGRGQSFLPPEETTKNTTPARPKHCEDVQTYLDENGIKRKNGVYRIYPSKDGSVNEFQNGVDVFCDLETDGGCWTVIQRRRDSTNFNRTWREYSMGFGNASRSYWLGLLVINELTKDRDVALRLDLEAFNGILNVTYAQFWVDGPENKFQLHSKNHSVRFHNGKMFSTFDQFNDAHATGNCAESQGAGWWFDSGCAAANLNGWCLPSQADVNIRFSMGWGVYIKLAEMKIRRSSFMKYLK